MGNRTSRHLQPGQHDLRGKKTKSVCFDSDDMMNHRDKIMEKIHQDEMEHPDEMGD